MNYSGLTKRISVDMLRSPEKNWAVPPDSQQTRMDEGHGGRDNSLWEFSGIPLEKGVC